MYSLQLAVLEALLGWHTLNQSQAKGEAHDKE